MYEMRKHKTEIRERYLARRFAILPETRRAADERICRNVLSTAAYRYADIVLFYYPVRGEIDIRPVVTAALAAGKRVAFPRCRESDRSMLFYFVDSEECFEDGSFGLREPKTSLPVLDESAAEGKNMLCIVPAVVYDKKGYRIGYGGGYYDRFLSKCSAATIGVIYGDFIMNTVPHGRYDISVDVVVSERGVYAGK